MFAPNRALITITVAALLIGTSACSDSSPDESGSLDGGIDGTGGTGGTTSGGTDGSTGGTTGGTSGTDGVSDPVPGFNDLGGTWRLTGCHMEMESRPGYDPDIVGYSTYDCEPGENTVTFNADGTYDVAGSYGIYYTASSSDSDVVRTDSYAVELDLIQMNKSRHWYMEGPVFYVGSSDSLFHGPFLDGNARPLDLSRDTMHVQEDDVARYFQMSVASLSGSTFILSTSHAMYTNYGTVGIDANRLDVVASYTFQRQID